MATNVLKCSLCGSLSLSFKQYVSHLRVVHGKDPLFNVMCGVAGCREVFRAFTALNSHVYRHHRAALGLDPDVSVALEQEPAPSMQFETPVGLDHESESEPHDGNDAEDTDVTTTGSRVEVETSPKHLQMVTSAKFLLKLREGRQLTQVAIADVTAGCKTLCRQAVDRINDGIEAALKDAGICCENVPGLRDAMNSDPDPFKGVDTNYLFEKFCIEHLGCLEAREIPFGMPYYVNKFSGSKRRKISKTDKFYYVPILECLKKLLELEDVQAEVMNSHSQGENNHLGDFCDGTHFQSHPLFGEDHLALQIIPYYDELEIVNPIGSYVKKHKLGCLFFFLGNIRPQFRSSLKAIHLVAVARSQDIDYYGLDTFLLPLVDDMKVLYCDGIKVMLGGVERILYGGVLAFLADTLAAHALGGFKESMSFALRICRSCMVTTPQIKECFLEISCVLRSPETHFKQCSLLCGPLRDHYSTTYGINRLSVLEELPGFSVVNGLPHDIMHDLFEGVVPYELKFLLRHCVNEGYFTIDQLNDRMERYDFSSDKPVVIDPKVVSNPSSKIRQSASQMMCLARELPFLIGDTIPDDDEHWYGFVLLLKICCISLSPVCTHDTVAYLRVLIEEKLFLFKHLYPGENMIPKQHYMIHYPAQIERLGPLINSWNMRQEAKLSFVKRLSRHSNYKNVCKTVAKKHQFWVCHLSHSDRHLLIPNLETSTKRMSCLLQEEEDYLQNELVRLIPSLTMESLIEHPSWVDIQSSHLCNGVYVLLEYDLVRPTFGKISDIATFDNTVVLCVQKYYGNVYHPHYCSYEICTLGVLIAVSMDILADHRPLHAKSTFLSSDKARYITLPYMY